ncbi:MAG: DUF2279 domain-containing protein [Calditrichaeota bacterium]|nr:MAG: DUF2279 domain-containing protein [Calditrichota bacterium]
MNNHKWRLLVTVLVIMSPIVSWASQQKVTSVPEAASKSDTTTHGAKQVSLRMGQDKYQHLVLSSFLVAGQMFVYQEQAGFEQKKAAQISVGTTMILGLTKEFYDFTSKKGHPSFRDLIANSIGIGIGILVFSLK